MWAFLSSHSVHESSSSWLIALPASSRTRGPRTPRIGRTYAGSAVKWFNFFFWILLFLTAKYCSQSFQSVRNFLSFTYPSHSAIAATHISFEISCLLQLNIFAFSGNIYSLVLILKPLPQDTEQALHSVYSVTAHSAITTNNYSHMDFNIKYFSESLTWVKIYLW